MVLSVTWSQALGWRMGRQLLDPLGSGEAEEVVRRLCAVQAQVLSAAEMAVRVRRGSSAAGEIAAALTHGRLIRTWAMRGTLHLMAPDQAGAYLALMASTRPWERPAWKRWAGLTPAVLDRFRSVVHDALADGPKTREELATVVGAGRGLGSIHAVMTESWGTILKPLAWLGELCVGPMQDGRPTYVRPDLASREWVPPPDVDVAAAAVVRAYFAAYGPAPKEAFVRWMGQGWFGKRPLLRPVNAVDDLLAPVEIEGERAFLLREDLDSLAAARPSGAVRLLPAFDQYVLGPGTDDGHVISPDRRRSVSRQSGWIAPVVIAGGAVSGTWAIEDGNVQVAWFAEAGAPPRSALDREVRRLAVMDGREARLSIATV